MNTLIYNILYYFNFNTNVLVYLRIPLFLNYTPRSHVQKPLCNIQEYCVLIEIVADVFEFEF